MAKKDEAAWNLMFDEAKVYFEKHGDLEVPASYVTENGKKLGVWIRNQRKLCDPTSERGLRLSEIGMRFTVRERLVYSWNDMYLCAVDYFNKYGDLEVPAAYVTPDGKKLGNWIQVQRSKCDPESKHGKLLLQIGMRFESRKRTVMLWDEMYEEAKKYSLEHGNLDVPHSYVTSDGKKLGQWLNTKKYTCDPKSKQGKLLIRLGFDFDACVDYDLGFMKNFDMLYAFYKEYGVGGVPASFKTNDGITYDENGFNLGMWYSKLFERCNSESERGIMLKNIGVCFDRSKLIVFNWEQSYKILQTYYDRVGNLNIPYDFRTCDGITYNKYGLGLKRWLYEQTKKCNPESIKGRLLRNLGVDLVNDGSGIYKNNYEINWLKMYKCAVEFFKEHGHLDVSVNSDDGNEVTVARWLAKQKMDYKKGVLSEKRISLLESIWIIWDVSSNKVKLAMLCDKYSIDICKNRDILEHMPCYVLENYINGLVENDMNVVGEDGRVSLTPPKSDDGNSYVKKKN